MHTQNKKEYQSAISWFIPQMAKGMGHAETRKQAFHPSGSSRGMAGTQVLEWSPVPSPRSIIREWSKAK